MDSTNCCTNETTLVSPVFGEKFPYPDSGKTVMLHLAQEFAREFNLKADAYRKSRNIQGTMIPLNVTSAYPTSKKHCPSIAVMLTSSTTRQSGIGNYLDSREVVVDEEYQVRIFYGQTVTDTVEVSICTLSPKLRDDLSLWFGQWMLDAQIQLIGQLPTVQEIRRTNVSDDMPEYTGCGESAFQFYLAAHTYSIQYDEIVLNDADRIESIINWQELVIGTDC
jgi:hypothetical protein